MELEDHLGDIIRKARTAARVSEKTAAQAAGLTTTELGVLEQSGHTSAPINFAALAPLIGLSAPKLQCIAQGWCPQPRDLVRWHGLRQISTTRGGNNVNCFLVWGDAAREAALFDTGWDAAPVVREVEENQLQLKRLFLTHRHEDHVAALEPLRKRFAGLLIYPPPEGAEPESSCRSDQVFTVGRLRVSPRPAPGHAVDGLIYVVERWPDTAPVVAVIGDTLFAGSLARGFVSTEQLRRAVLSQIFTLPPDTLLCPGHGPVTTVGEELACNPFF